MEITGRIVSDAEVRKTKGGKEVVSFTVAVNDGYKAKDGEWKDLTEFINCSYWLSSKVADSLMKGAIVTASGRIHLNEYQGRDGNHYANLAFHANGIKIIATTKKKAVMQPTEAAFPDSKDDLPF